MERVSFEAFRTLTIIGPWEILANSVQPARGPDTKFVAFIHVSALSIRFVVPGVSGLADADAVTGDRVFLARFSRGTRVGRPASDYFSFDASVVYRVSFEARGTFASIRARLVPADSAFPARVVITLVYVCAARNARGYSLEASFAGAFRDSVYQFAISVRTALYIFTGI